MRRRLHLIARDLSRDRTVRRDLLRHIDERHANIAADLGLAENCVNIKGKTNEKLGYLGRMEGIEAQAVVLLEKAVG